MLSVPVVAEERESRKLSADKSSVTVGEEEVASSKVVGSNNNNNKNRCGCCNKKVGVVGFKCRCGFTFCGSHRYPEEHNCEFDHKFAGREALAKANPLVVADKLQRI
ncbi:Zinc finger A20 and AN1 domain-containing stress-associated protein 7 [Bienertia sinuspersici]